MRGVFSLTLSPHFRVIHHKIKRLFWFYFVRRRKRICFIFFKGIDKPDFIGSCLYFLNSIEIRNRHLVRIQKNGIGILEHVKLIRQLTPKRFGYSVWSYRSLNAKKIDNITLLGRTCRPRKTERQHEDYKAI